MRRRNSQRSKSQSVLFLLLVLTCATQHDIFSQSRRDPVLVDEFESLSCDGFRGRIDSFFMELSKNPTWFGVVVNRGDKIFQLNREDAIRNKVDYRNFNKKRISYVRTRASESNKTQLWRIPKGTAFPIDRTDIDDGFALSESRPRMLFVDSPYDEGDCPKINSRELFASVLKANRTARGNIVIRFRTLQRSQRERSQLLYFLVRRHGIETKRIRTFLRTQPRDRNEYQATVEYWYLP
jgi:hypothetical protein